jgi:Kelch motif
MAGRELNAGPAASTAILRFRHCIRRSSRDGLIRRIAVPMDPYEHTPIRAELSMQAVPGSTLAAGGARHPAPIRNHAGPRQNCALYCGADRVTIIAGGPIQETRMRRMAKAWVIILLPASALAGWEERTPMPAARSEMPAAYWKGSIYVPGGLGGMRQFEAYAIKADRWNPLQSMPVQRHHLMTLALGGKIYIFGGATPDWTPTADVWVFDLATGVWKRLSPMPEERSAGTAVALDGLIYIAGGEGPSGRLLRYDPMQDRWLRLTATAWRRDHSSAVVFEGRIVVIGGRYPATGELNSTEIYDLKTDTWKPGPSLKVARAGHAAVVHRNQILVLGGEVILTGRNTLADAEILDRLDGKWRPGVELPKPLHGMPAVSDGKHVYIIGGSDRAAAAENRGRVYRLQE